MKRRRHPTPMPSITPAVFALLALALHFIPNLEWPRRPLPEPHDPLQCIASAADSPLLPQGALPGLMGMMLPLKQHPDGANVRGWMRGHMPIHTRKSDADALSKEDRMLRDTHKRLLSSLLSDYAPVPNVVNPEPLLFKWSLLRKPSNATTAVAQLAHSALHLHPSLFDDFICSFADMTVTLPFPLAHPDHWIVEKRKDCELHRLRRNPLDALKLFLHAAHSLRSFCPREGSESIWKVDEHPPASHTIAKTLKSLILTRVAQLAHTEALHTSRLANYHCKPSCPAAYVSGTSEPAFSSASAAASRSAHHTLYRVSSPAYVFGHQVPTSQGRERLDSLAEMWSVAIWAEWLGNITEKISRVVERECSAVLKVVEKEVTAVLDAVVGDGDEEEKAMDVLQRVVRMLDEKLAASDIENGTKDDDDSLLGLFAAAPSYRNVEDSSSSKSNDKDDEEDDDEPANSRPILTGGGLHFLSESFHASNTTALYPPNVATNAKLLDRLWRSLAWGKEFLRERITPRLLTDDAGRLPPEPDLESQVRNARPRKPNGIQSVEQCLFHPFDLPSAAENEAGNDDTKRSTSRNAAAPNREAGVGDVYHLSERAIWMYWLQGARPRWKVWNDQDEQREESGKYRAGGAEGEGIKMDDVLFLRAFA